MSVVVIGKNSFLATGLKKLVGSEDWVFLSHKEALEENFWLEGAKHVVNCAFSPFLYQGTYTKEQDIDLQIISKIRLHSDIKYILISSRSVYGNTEHINDMSTVAPINEYGKNKVIIETTAKERLRDNRLLVLRFSNVFGKNSHKRTFFGGVTQSLKTKNEIIYNMSPKTMKDFIPVHHACKIIQRAIQYDLSGTYNASYGTSYNCGDIAKWLIEGYGSGELIINNAKIHGQFYMDSSRINRILNLKDRTHNEVQDLCLTIGRDLQQ